MCPSNSDSFYRTPLSSHWFFIQGPHSKGLYWGKTSLPPSEEYCSSSHCGHRNCLCEQITGTTMISRVSCSTEAFNRFFLESLLVFLPNSLRRFSANFFIPCISVVVTTVAYMMACVDSIRSSSYCWFCLQPQLLRNLSPLSLKPSPVIPEPHKLPNNSFHLMFHLLFHRFFLFVLSIFLSIIL